MLRWSLMFFIVSIIAAIFGFGGIADAASEVAQVLFFFFLVVCVATLIASLLTG